MDALKYILILAVLLWIGLSAWAVMDIAKRATDVKKRQHKTAWTNIVVIFPFLGLLAYGVYGRRTLR
ncbi:PLDc N-terminal domain-containing protein [Pedobacter nanyangensis]|uniref:PLDc N-terminal domain-containing protein n=1 Tax=Pedobacter nanyangensis TaxID=1562389 RepID=UPI000DE27E43|nr:PLDc N-terminal domain-containing protein [Pedobacter nanyangensis]